MPMHTIGTLILDPSTLPSGRFDRAHVVRHLKRRIHRLPPFRQRLLGVPLDLAAPVLADDPEFRVEHHVHRRRLRKPGGERELAELVAEIAVPLLARDKPLWEMWLVEGLAENRCAIVTKLHHCMIDGATGASQMANLLDFTPDDQSPRPPVFRPAPLPSALDLLRDSLGTLPDARKFAQLVRSTSAALIDRARRGELAGLLPNAPRTPFSGAAGTARAVAFGSAALDDVKQVKNAFDVTLNDAVLAACTLALRRYLIARDALPAQPIACAVPVSIKSEAELREFSNKVSAMTVELPTHLDDPEAIVQGVAQATRDAKRAFEASDPELLLGWLDVAPAGLLRLGARALGALRLADYVTMPWNCVVSNMRGAPFPLYFAGARVIATYPMGPVGDGVGVNITVLSNMDRLDFGVLASRALVPDVWELADGFGAAIEELRGLAAQRAASPASVRA